MKRVPGALAGRWSVILAVAAAATVTLLASGPRGQDPGGAALHAVVGPPVVRAAGGQAASEPSSEAESSSAYGCHVIGSPVCFDTPPKIQCCSLAAVAWSQIVVGESFVMSGQARMGSGVHALKSIRLVKPSGATIDFPLDANGRFHDRVSFDETGKYRIVDPDGADLESFWVPYRADTVGGTTFRQMFGQDPPWGGLQLLLMVPAGETSTLRLRLTDADGVPAANASIPWGNRTPLKTDGDGVVSIPYDDAQADFALSYSFGAIYEGVFVLGYRTLQLRDGALVGFPSGAALRGTRFDGKLLFPVGEFLSDVTKDTILQTDPAGACAANDARLPCWDGEDRLLVLSVPGSSNGTGPPLPGFVIQPDVGQMWTYYSVLGTHEVVATFDAAEKDGVVYADLNGLAEALNALPGGHAAVAPDGDLVVTAFQLP